MKMDNEWSFKCVQLVAAVNFAVGCSLNLLLLWLIFWRTEKLLRVWSYVLLQTAFVDLAMLVAYFLTQPVLITNATVTKAFCFLYGPIRWIIGNNQPLALALFYVQNGFQEFAKYSLAVQFVYRWLVICRKWDVSARKYALFLCVPAVPTYGMIGFMHYGWLRDGVGPPTVEDGVDVQQYTTTFAYSLPMNSTFTTIVASLTLACNATTYLIIIACILMIWLTSRNTLQHQSQQKSRDLRNQVGRVLIAQATLNLLLILLPSLSVVFINLNFNQQQLQWISLLMIQNWSSVFAPLFTMLMIGTYRRALLNVIRCNKLNMVSDGGNQNTSSENQQMQMRQIQIN